jgi:hypothetical protein
MAVEKTPSLGLNFGWVDGDSNWGGAVNWNWILLDAVAVPFSKSATVTTPPASPVEGDRYIVPTGATGVWAAHIGRIAYFASSQWVYYQPNRGWYQRLWDTRQTVVWDGSAWVVYLDAITPELMTSINLAIAAGISTAADRLAVSGMRDQVVLDAGAASDSADASEVSRQAAVTAAGSATAAKVAAEAAQALSQAASVASAVALAAKDTIAIGRGLVADGVTFWVKPNTTDALTRFTCYLRTSSTTQTFVASSAVGAEIDATRADFPRIGRNKFSNPTFAKAALGALGSGVAPSGYGGVDKAGTAGISYAGAAIVEKANKILRTNRVLELTHASTVSTGTDYQLYQTIDIPSELWGDTTLVCRFVYLVQHEVPGINSVAVAFMMDGANADLGAATATKVSTDGAVGEWYYVVYDFAITNALTRKVRCKARSHAGIGPTVAGKARIGGIFFDFSRPDQVTFDRNLPEEISDIAGSLATSTAAAAILPLQTDITAIKSSVTDLQSATWKIGTNPLSNPLMTADAIGLVGNPTGYVVNAGGNGSTAVITKGISAVATPFGTDRAFSATHFFDGTLHTDIQLYQELNIPEIHWGDTTLKARFIYYVKNSDARINSSAYFAAFNEAGSIIVLPAFVKASTDGAVNTWYPVIHDVNITDPLARKLRFSTRQNASRLSGNFSGAISMTTALFAGFNRQAQNSFDRNAAYEADQLAKARVDALRTELSAVKPRTLVGAFDNYIDARGNILPALPNYAIACFGDSMTAANWAATLSAKYTPARTCYNMGIGGETSIQILARINGVAAYTTGITWAPGTIRLRARRPIPSRTIDEAYRASWATYGATIAEPTSVEFLNTSSLIARSNKQLKAVSAVSGVTLSAVAHPFANGDTVYVLDVTVPTGMYRYKPYYVRDAVADSYSLAEFSAGAAVSFGAGSVTVLGDWYYDWAYTSQNTTITCVTHTGNDKSNVVLWMGRNNIGSPAQVAADVQASITQIKTLTKRFAVLTVCNDAADIVGTAAYNNIATINANLAALYPDNVVDIRGYLLTKGNGSGQDNTDVANGVTPTSLRADSLHLNSTGNAHVADLVYAFFFARGW